MRLAHADVVPLLCILAGGAVGFLASGSLLILSHADDVPYVVAPPGTAEATRIYVVAGESLSESSERAVGSTQLVVAVAGDNQVADPGALLRSHVRVLVTDESGRPIAGAEVRFEVRSGTGMVAPSLSRTDSYGLAYALWRLGREVGTQELLAVPSSGPESAVTFTATARN